MSDTHPAIRAWREVRESALFPLPALNAGDALAAALQTEVGHKRDLENLYSETLVALDAERAALQAEVKARREAEAALAKAEDSAAAWAREAGRLRDALERRESADSSPADQGGD